ncbi:MAG TPA: sigma 54-interacting transcriptional regulator [Anaeromyxobacteraceae bacterium]|nr:sigma 54-interacting transcriptional regulator [Anaeromyxobacteraceae bacterium]
MAIAPSMSMRQLAAILDSIVEGLIAVDTDGRIVLFNQQAAAIIGRPVREALGRPVRDVVPNTRLPDVLASGQDELNRRQEVGSTTIITSRMVVRDPAGTVEGAVAIFRDVGEVQELAAQVRTLKDLRELSEAIIRCSEEAIAVSDEHGNYVVVNPAYSALMGLSAEEVLHRPVTVDIRQGESVHLRVLRTRKPIRGARLRVGPHQKDVVVNAAPLLVGGELRGSVGVIHDVSEIRRLSEELATAKEQLRRLESRHTFEDIIGDCPPMARAKELALRAARTPATVLLLGESGTGKEMFAHAIHHASDRRDAPFIRVNCAAIPDSLIESALFGYEGGAFTGARPQGQRGHFEEADGGSLFLDEVADAPLAVQAKVLRALQEREIVRVGSSSPRPVDVRVIAATHADLDALVARGEFRQDLFYRLSVMPIRIPSLGERREDIPVLARTLLARICADYRLVPIRLSQDALDLLLDHPWKGNVREMENLLGRAVIHMQPGDEVLSRTHLDQAWGAGARAPAPAGPEVPGRFAELKRAWERQVLEGALARHGGNRAATARSLGITVRNLYYKLGRHGLLRGGDVRDAGA